MKADHIPSEHEREIYAYRVASLFPYVRDLSEYGFDALKEFGGFESLSDFCDYILTCSGNRYMTILETCMTTLQNYQNAVRETMEDIVRGIDKGVDI